MTYKDAVQAAREHAMLYGMWYIVCSHKKHWYSRKQYDYCFLNKLTTRNVAAVIAPDGRIH
jgi:hypothetical protein